MEPIQFEDGHFDGTIVLIDFMNIAIRNAFIAVSKDPEDNRRWTIWADKTIGNIIDMVSKFKADRLVICVDSKGSGYWRKEVFPEYKAHRSKYRKDAKIDFSSLNDAITSFVERVSKILTNVYVMRIDRAESDDLIAVITKHHGSQAKIVIVSGDRDFCQLQTRFHDVHQFDWTQKKFVLVPDPLNHIDQKVITGDRNDGIPPIKRGMGPKTAKKYIDSGVNIMECSDKQMVDNYKRNRLLIDFDFIPDDIRDEILSEYKSKSISPLNPGLVFSFINKISPENGAMKWQMNHHIFNSLR